ncbi:MAG: mannose-6-phosphate isomerase, class I [Acidimicrobiia bacterium]
MRLVRGVVQHYSWGDPTSIPEMLGLDGDGRPWAELWFGTHLGGPSKVLEVSDGAMGKPALTDDTGGLFSPLVALSGELPFLLKILAAVEPLSLQSHPSLEQARAGYARENRLDIPIGNSRRIYRDPFAKPELICALGPFEALCGFREEVESVRLLHSIGGGASRIARMLTDHDLDHTVRYLFGSSDEVRLLRNEVVEACRRHDSASAQWATRLADGYPDDPAVVVTLLLNHVVLKQGEALYLGPGNLHAYLRGTGVEVMGSSDNVVRCGLTNKHVDVNELLATVVPRALSDPVVRPTPVARTDAGRLWRYDTPGAPFTLWIHQVSGTETLRARTRELTLCGSGSTDRLQRGEVAYLAPGEELTVTGKATLFRVTEP